MPEPEGIDLVDNRVEVCDWRGRGYLVSSGEHGRRGLVIHGYGSNSTEMLGLAVGLACRLELRMLVFDLPGHGGAGDEVLGRDSALSAARQAVDFMDGPDFFIGHSLGARAGLAAGLKTAVLISMPGPADFEGSRTEMLRTLRPRRVNEGRPFSGLKEILASDVQPAPGILMLRASHDLQSVRQLFDDWENNGVPCRVIKHCNHNDIISASETEEAIAAWLKHN